MMDIKAEVKTYIVDNFLMGSGGEEIADDTSFLEQDLLDSTGVLELISFMEESYEITVDDEEMLPENLDSLNAIEAYVTKKRGEQS